MGNDKTKALNGCTYVLCMCGAVLMLRIVKS